MTQINEDPCYYSYLLSIPTPVFFNLKKRQINQGKYEHLR